MSEETSHNLSETIVDLLRDGSIDEEGEYSLFTGSTDRKLTKAGKKEMQAQTQQPDPGWDAVISSPLKRCASVAKTVAKKHGIPLKMRKELAEYDYGEWENQPVAQIIQQSSHLFEAFMQDPFDAPPPGAQPYQVFHDAVLKQWESLLKTYEGQHILVVTHGGPMRAILGQVLAMRKQSHLRLEVPAACLSRVRSLGADWPTMLVSHNTQSAKIAPSEK